MDTVYASEKNVRHRPENWVARWPDIAGLLNERKMARVVLALLLGALGSIPLVFLTPPFQTPDEGQHFYRAYELSELHIRAEVQNGVAGDMLPASLPLLVRLSVYTPDGVFYPPTPAPLMKTLKLASIPLNPSVRQFVAFPGSAFYSPLPYLPQALGLVIGRAIGLGPLYLLYLGRLLNCLAALSLVGIAVNFVPVAEELIILVGLLPMSLFLYASLSPDAAVIGCALVFSALSLTASTRGSWKSWELGIAASAAAVFCSVKPVYAPILLAAVVPGIFQRGRARRVFRSHAILLAVALGVTAGWLLLAKSTMTSPLSGAHPSVQMGLIFHHPMSFVRAFAGSLGIFKMIHLYFEAVGDFGWVTLPLKPGFAYLLPLAGLVLVWKLGVRGSVERSVRNALWRLGLAFASAVLVMAAMYLMYAHVGQNDVTGVQGRYFIPLFAMAGFAAIELGPRGRPSSPRWRSFATVAGIVVLEIAAMDFTILRAFQVFSPVHF
jgi:hypothetical protein